MPPHMYQFQAIAVDCHGRNAVGCRATEDGEAEKWQHPTACGVAVEDAPARAANDNASDRWGKLAAADGHHIPAIAYF